MVVALICGGGNGAHVCAGIAAAQPGVESRVLTLFADEAERWTKAMVDNDFVISIHSGKDSPTKLSSKPSLVTKNVVEAVTEVDIIIFMVPAFAHAQYLEELKPHVRPGMVIAGCPGQAGFEFAVRGTWGGLASHVTLTSFDSLPWACRITEFGRAAEALGTKATLTGAVSCSLTPPAQDPIEMLQKVLGAAPRLVITGHLLGITLMGVNGYVHPAIMYGRWHAWDGKPLQEAPLFYNGLDEFSANLLSAMSDEICAVAKAIMTQRPEVNLNNVHHILDWFHNCYSSDISDSTNLYTSIRTNRAYVGLVHPCLKKDDGLYVPNFSYRYLTEDIPFGLVVMRGIATIAGVATPNMDRVIYWAQKLLNQEYLVDGQLKGKDIDKTRCPQRYGLNDLDAIL